MLHRVRRFGTYALFKIFPAALQERHRSHGRRPLSPPRRPRRSGKVRWYCRLLVCKLASNVIQRITDDGGELHYPALRRLM